MGAAARRLGALSVAALAAALCLWAGPRAARAQGAWDRIQARGYLLVGVPAWLPPFGAPSSAGPWQGLDVALARALAAQALGSPARLHLLPLTPDQRLWALREGGVDAVAAAFAVPVTAAGPGPAPAGVRLVGPYFTDRLALLVRRGDRVRSPASLDGQLVGVLPGSRAASALLLAVPGVRPVVREVSGAPAAMAALGSGRLRALVAGSAVLAALAGYDRQLMVQPWPALGSEQYWLLLPAGRDRLLPAAGRAIAALPRGAALAASLRAWGAAPATPWPGPRPVPPALAPEPRP